MSINTTIIVVAVCTLVEEYTTLAKLCRICRIDHCTVTNMDGEHELFRLVRGP
jgi:hypothetical protein